MGPFSYEVVIETNDPKASPLRIPVRGVLEQPVFFNAPTVFFRELLPQEKAETAVKFDLPRWLAFSSLKLKMPQDGPLKAELVRQEQGGALMVQWNGSAQPGLYSGEIEVLGQDVEDANASKLPWSVEVLPVITAFPPILWVNAPPRGQHWTRRLSIESRRDLLGGPSIRWSDEDVAKEFDVEIATVNPRKLEVRLSGTFPSTGSLVMTVLVGDYSVSIPIRFLQSGKDF
jgi:hypothetical protein